MANVVWAVSKKPRMELELSCDFSDSHQTYRATIEGMDLRLHIRAPRSAKPSSLITECMFAVERAYEVANKAKPPEALANAWENLVTEGVTKLLGQVT